MSQRITGYTGLVGLFADPIKHSISPAMHNAAFEKTGLDYAYLAFEVNEDELADGIRSIRSMHMLGANISMPYKAKVIDYLDALSPGAELIGAVNTIVNQDGRLTGHNTDGTGFMMSLADKGVDVIGKKLTIGGCGGAATAIIVQAALDGVKEISIFNVRDGFWEKGEETVAKINAQTDCRATLYDFADSDALRSQIAESALLINATGLGMKPHEGKTWLPDASYLRPELVVADTIYAPPKTRFLEIAEGVGCRIINGHGMLLFQGVAAFKLWTGVDMPVDYVRQEIGFAKA